MQAWSPGLRAALAVLGLIACSGDEGSSDDGRCGADCAGTGTTPVAGTAPPTGGTMAPPPDPYSFLCKGPGQSCAENADCCNKTCVAGKCEIKQCGGLGAACEGDADCCDGPCRVGACGDAATMCRTEGSACTDSAECCSTTCLEGTCAPTGTMAACDMALGPCDNFPQCGCAPGEVCHTADLDTGSRACKPVGAAGAYQACTDMFSCVADHVCVAGECKQYCGDDFDCPLTHRRCAPVGRSATETIPGFDVCWAE